MLISMHVTHSSSGGTSVLNDVVPTLEAESAKQIRESSDIREYVIVRTCNRFEIYAAVNDIGSVKSLFDSIIWAGVPSSNISYILEDKDTIRHLFRVVCGLDSLIVGEDQIQHQVRESYIKAKEEGHVNGMLTRLFDKALSVGKRVRTETALNKGAVSVGSAAVELAEMRLGNLEGKAITILGAGDIASVIAKNLIGRNLGTVIVSNRTYSRALELADELGGKAVSMTRLTDAVADSDVVLVATGAPHAVLKLHHVSEAMTNRPERQLVIIDVSVPSNTDASVTDIPNVQLENMDSLESIAMKNTERRRSEISSAERIISEELIKIDAENRDKRANEAIRRIGLMVAEARNEELSQAVSRIGTTETEQLLDDMSRALVNRITADLYRNLREISREGRTGACDLALELLGLEDSE